MHNPGSLRGIPHKALAQAIRAADAIIVSDYGYGNIVPALVTQLVHAAGEKGIPLVVDSRFRMSEFSDVTSITPNITELEAAVGISIGNDAALLQEVGQRVLREQRLQSLLVTQGKFGMTLFEKDKAPLHIPIFGTDEIADVTGAGDTVIAVFTLALACGAAPENAARLANYGGGIVVMKRGTATVARRELRAAIQTDLKSEI
jgi:rfaE bifunctional protein kinase chain/domain